MPSSYAHYRFGSQLIPILPADVRRPVLRHRALFDMGLHGPDFLFFHDLFKPTNLFQVGSRYHEQSGRVFFTRVCAQLRTNTSEAGSAYLYGLLTHYCLDSYCHPLVYSMTDDGSIGHSELETEFDRFLLALDGHKKPHEVSLSRHMKLNSEDISTVAAFYPDTAPKDVAKCIRNMALAQQLTAIPTLIGHLAVEKVTKMANKNTAGKVMTIGPNPNCAHLNAPLLERYQQALTAFPAYLEQLSAHMAYGEPLGDHFTANFNRG